MLNSLQLNKYGFYEVINKPSQNDLNEYYKNKYYQLEKGNYSKSYDSNEIEYINRQIFLKHHIIKSLTENILTENFLDIGCGEGFVLNFFKKQKFNVTGIDFSSSGISQHNSDCLDTFIEGDIFQSIEQLLEQKEIFDIIWLDNVLEHVINPLELLINCQKLSHTQTILVIEVPNDFSEIQMFALSNNYIDNPFWVALPDHLSYFNRTALNNLASDAGWECKKTIADFPIDFNLLNPESNYISKKSKGKSAHIQRMTIDSLINKNSEEIVVKYYESLAGLGMGRQIISFFKPV